MDLPSTRRFVTAGAARLAVAGAAAGLLEAIALFAKTAVPTGKAGVVALLVLLYGGTLGLCGALLGLLAAGWARATDAGRFVAAAFHDEDVTLERRPGWAYAGAAVLLGFVYPAALAFCRDALTRYHHRGLIAALVAVVVVGVWVGVLLLWPVLASLLSLAKPKARVAASAITAGGAALLVWGLGLVAVLFVLALYLLRVQGLAKMQPAQRASAFAIVATVVCAVATPLCFVAARAVGKRIARAGWRHFPTVLAVALGGVTLILVGVSAYGWTTVKQLDFRPFAAGGIGLTTFLALSLIPAPPTGRLTPRLATMLGVLAACLVAFVVGARLGERPAIRKVAMAQTGLLPILSRGLQLISDRDRDGYAALLGGGDCDDGDATVHPGAFDWPDDGVDQDCNGNQASLAARKPRAHADRPETVPADLNVLLITIDALRADHVSAYGYKRPTTPTLDALAQNGVLFQNAWSHAPSTRYSIPAIITGRYPSTIKVGSANWPPDLLPENRLLPEMLKDLGYVTGGTFTYHYFAPGWRLNQGFDEYDYSLQTLHSIGGDPAKTRGTSAAPLTDKNIAFLEAHKDQKFFLWTHYYDTHFMFEPHPDAPETDFGKREMDLYDGEIRYTDLQLSRLFAKLDELGLMEKTLIVITADHGEGFGEHNIPPNRRHGYHLYRTETKVPLIIRVPGLPPRVVTEAASHVDIVPTILDLLGRPGTDEPQLLGDSLLPQMIGQSGASGAARKIFQEVWYEGPTSKKAVVSDRFHFIRNLVPEDTRELYDLVADPDEDHDRQGAPEEEDLDRALAAWMDAIAIPDDFAKKVEGAVSKTPISASIPLGDSVGEWLVLEGAEVVTPSAARGTTAQIDLIWRIKSRPPAEWRIFTHVLSVNGQRINADHQPIENLLPLAQLQPGTYVRDRVKVVVPGNFPTGAARVVVGLWKPNVRAPITGKHGRDDAVEVATFEVTP